MFELIEKLRNLHSAFQTGDYWEVLKIVGELMTAIADLKIRQPVFAAAPNEKADLESAVNDLESDLGATPKGAVGAEAVGAERWDKIKEVIRFALEMLRLFI